MNNPNFNLNPDDLIEFLNEYLVISDKYLLSIQDQSAEEYQRILRYFIERFHVNTRTLTFALESQKKIKKYSFAVATLIRPLINDLLIYMTLLNVNGNNPEEEIATFDYSNLSDRYRRISLSFFQRLQKQLKDLVDSGEISLDQKKSFLENEKILFPQFFEESDFPSVLRGSENSMAKGLSNNLKSGLFKDFSKIYYLYFFYSALEHFSVKTENLMEMSREKSMENLIRSLDFLLRGILLIGMHISKDDLEKIKGFSQMINKFNVEILRST